MFSKWAADETPGHSKQMKKSTMFEAETKTWHFIHFNINDENIEKYKHSPAHSNGIKQNLMKTSSAARESTRNRAQSLQLLGWLFLEPLAMPRSVGGINGPVSIQKHKVSDLNKRAVIAAVVPMHPLCMLENANAINKFYFFILWIKVLTERSPACET